MVTIFFRAFGQFSDFGILRLILISALLSVVVTSTLSFLLYWVFSLTPLEEIPLIGDLITETNSSDWILASSIFLVILPFWLFIFPYVLLLMTALFQEQIIDLVEARHYPNLPIPMKRRLSQEIMQQARFFLKVFLINLVLLPLYLILLFTGFGLIVLLALVNGYLIGVEYYSMVSQRRLTRSQHEKALRKNRVSVHLYGIGLYVGMLVPVLNLVIPVLGCIIMTHLFFSHNEHNSFMTSPQE